METTIQEKTVEALDTSGKALYAAQQLAQRVDAEKTAASRQAPAIAQALVDARIIDATELSDAITKLASHDSAVAIVGNLASYIPELRRAYEQKIAVLNNGEPLMKDAAETNQGANQPPLFRGARAGLGEQTPADVVFLQQLGIGS